MIDAPLHLVTLLFAVTALGFWLESRFRWAAKVGASLLIIAMGALLSNLNLVPLSAPVYDLVFGPVTSLAIVWLLLAVDFRDLKAAGPTMLLAFGVAVLGTALGAVVAALFFAGSFDGSTWKLAGVMTGTYSGGSLNFVAVARALELPSYLFSASSAADNVITALWFAATLLLPGFLARRGKRGRRPLSEPSKRTEEADATVAHPIFAETGLKVVDLCLLAALGLAVLVVGGWIERFLPAVPGVIWITTLALLAGQLPPVRKLSGAIQLGSIALHLFFVLIGIGSKFSEIAAVGFAIFFFTLTVVLVHGLVLFGFAWFRSLEGDTASVASQAAIGGPSTAMALALARGRASLALPGIAVGLLGYAVGTYAGLAIAHAVKALT